MNAKFVYLFPYTEFKSKKTLATYMYPSEIFCYRPLASEKSQWRKGVWNAVKAFARGSENEPTGAGRFGGCC